MAKKIIPKVPTNKKVYTNASIEKIWLLFNQTIQPLLKNFLSTKH